MGKSIGHLVAFLQLIGFYTPTKRPNAQHLVEFEKHLLQAENLHATAYASLHLWYKFEVRKFLILLDLLFV